MDIESNTTESHNSYSPDVEYPVPSAAFNFPRTLNHKIWERYLDRSLDYSERYILEDCRAEKHMNLLLGELYKQFKDKSRYYVPLLTNLDGNCMFESFVHHELAHSVAELRRVLSTLMYIYQDYKGFLPGTDSTLREMFEPTNEVKYVSSKHDDERLFYKYTYNVMCQDLTNYHSWTRLPAQLMLMVISYIYKVEVIIIGSSGSEHKINAFDNVVNPPTLRKVHLGHLGESHYVPIDVLPIDEEIDPMYYDEAKCKLLNWGKQMQNMKVLNFYEEQTRKQEMETNTINMTQIQQQCDVHDGNIFHDIDLNKIVGNDTQSQNYTVFF